MEKIDIKDLAKGELEERLAAIGEAPYRATQVFKWLYASGARSFDEMSDLPAALRASLKEKFRIARFALLDSKRSMLDGTAKYLFKLADGNAIEAVFLPEARRATICLSSQVGCKFSCSFCASAPFGFVRDLTSGEILEEVIEVKAQNRERPPTNVVFMGIGEPLDNYENAMKAIRTLNDPGAFNIGARRITISTCGIIPGIERLKKERLQIELSVSLHSADDKIRSSLIPVNKRYPLEDLMKACRGYTDETGRVVTFEYVLIKRANSSRADAVKLTKLLKGMKCKVNIILYNQIKARGLAAPSKAEAGIFARTLRSGGINAIFRKSKGEDIDAGCGQLRIARL
jgi:23S rRNA (adenine2503-C2)-methyltransferase